jgi:hypothetical protein
MSKRPLLILLCMALASCGPGAAPSGSTGSRSFAYVRFVNASPDIETTNPALPPSAPACNFGTTTPATGNFISVQINGVTATSSFPYESVSPYIPLPSGVSTISVTAAGSLQTGCVPLTFTTPSLATGSYQTIVVSGVYQNKTLQFLVFDDPAPSSSPGVQINNASPQSGVIGVGTFLPGTAAYQSTGSVAFAKSAELPSASAAPGLAFFAGSTSSPVTIEPSQVYAFDTGNVVPFENYDHLSLFIVDPPLGSTSPHLAGGFY